MAQTHNSAFLLTFVAFFFDLTSTFDPGYCQIYSYNIRTMQTGPHERHYFACCTTIDDHACRGFTYQRPSRTEGLCLGHSIQREGTHWTEMETSFESLGRFGCGGCCGQQRAWQACNEVFVNTRWPACRDWVSCFQRQCKKYVHMEEMTRPLDCNKETMMSQLAYYREVVRNKSEIIKSTETDNKKRIGVPQSPASFLNACARCQHLDMATRCKLACCEPHCCGHSSDSHPSQVGGRHFSERSSILLGLKPLQIAGIAFGAVLLMAALVGLVIVIIRRVVPGCEKLGPRREDTQILVIEGQEDVDSDQDDE